MRDRGGHQEPVARFDQPVRTDLADPGRGSNYGCAERPWPAGGAGGVQDHPHRVGVEDRPAVGVGTGQRRGSVCPGVGSPRTTTT